MANADDFAGRLAPLLRLSPDTVRRHLGQLFELVPPSGHLDGNHAAIIGLSLAAMGADDPAEVTAKLCACEMETPMAGWAITLRGAISVGIQAGASAIAEKLPPPKNDDWRIWISVDPVFGWMTWAGEGVPAVRYIRAPLPDAPQEPSPHDARRGVTRVTVLDSKIMAALAQLAADSLAKPRLSVV